LSAVGLRARSQPALGSINRDLVRSWLKSGETVRWGFMDREAFPATFPLNGLLSGEQMGGGEIGGQQLGRELERIVMAEVFGDVASGVPPDELQARAGS